MGSGTANGNSFSYTISHTGNKPILLYRGTQRGLDPDAKQFRRMHSETLDISRGANCRVICDGLSCKQVKAFVSQVERALSFKPQSACPLEEDRTNPISNSIVH